MVNFSTFSVAAVAALASTATAARTCTVNQIYCGFTLLVEPDFNFWTGQINDALARAGQPPPGGNIADYRTNSLFICTDGASGRLDYVDFCLDNTNPSGQRCQPASNDNCRFGRPNDCCGR